MKKYLCYIRNEVHPTLSRGAAEIIKGFYDFSDPAGRYMYHCHLLEHEDGGMMGQFVVVEPSDK